MGKVPNAKVIEAFEIIELIANGGSDIEIGKVLGCHSTVIAKMRRTMMGVKPTIKAPIVKVRKDTTRDGPPIKDYATYQAERSIENGSRNLLIRQLETGQHLLNKDRFIAIVKEIGLESRLPRKLMQ